MSEEQPQGITRRQFLKAAVGAAATVAIAGCAPDGTPLPTSKLKLRLREVKMNGF